MSAGIDLIARIAFGRRLVVCVGPGGVGKTTFAAALALAAARSGRRTFVLTIDPARRLADALGIALGDAEAAIDVPGGGTLHAAMLETQASWDQLVGRAAPDPETRERILANRVYRAFSRTLARSHAYVAMERLHHVLGERDEGGRPRWDLVVLDTPPTRSALDVLDAPSSLARFVDERVVGALAGSSLLSRPGAIAVRQALALILGSALAGELTEFLTTFVPMRAGFARRSAEIHARFSDAATSFVLVAAPLAAHLDDARFLERDLARRGVSLDAIVFNRAHHDDPARPGAPIARELELDVERALALLSTAPGGSEQEARATIDALITARRRALADDARAEAAMDGYLTDSPRTLALALPLLAREPCSPIELLALLEGARSVSVD